MAKQTIDIGASANDGTGDPLRTAFDKANDNFDELYAADAAARSETTGGTGQTTYTTGDILYASAADTLSKLAAGTEGHVLTMGASVPEWAEAAGGSSFDYTALSGLTALAGADLATGDLFAVGDVSATTNKKSTLADLIVAVLGSSGKTGATVTTSTPLINQTQTWNDSGVAFTGWLFNVTNTASASGSKIIDLQVGGSSAFTVYRDAVSNGFQIAGSETNVTRGIWMSGNEMTFRMANNVMTMVNSAGAKVGQSLYIGWTSGHSHQGSPDLALYRDGAAGTLAQRNGTNAQEHRLYGTYTDSSNYRRLTQKMSTAGVAEIKPEGAGTGSSGNVLHISGLPTANPGAGILWNDSGTVKVGT